jgi:hypothetical protein
MLAVDLKKHNVDPAEILKDSLNEKLLGTLTRFANILSLYGLPVKVYSENSLKKLNEISVEKKEQINTYFENWISWIDPRDTKPLPIEEIEKSCLRKALAHFGLKASNDFLDTIENNQVVELYGADMVQLYRSLNFFRITGYSLLDMTVFEWYVLWNRPSKAIEDTIADCNKVIGTYVPVVPFKVSGQLIREMHQTGLMVEPFVQRAIHARFRNVGSLMAADDTSLHGTPKGFICTSTAEIIAYGEEATNIQFI